MRLENASLACALLLLGGQAQGVSAAGLDTAQPLICAATEVVGCVASTDCASGTPEQFNLPVLLRVDVAKKSVGSVRVGGAKRASVISRVEESDGMIVLQGTDEDAGWSLTINQATGSMTVASARDGLTFSIFGTCSTL